MNNVRVVFVIDMFSYASMDEACCAPNILLIAVVTLHVIVNAIRC